MTLLLQNQTSTSATIARTPISAVFVHDSHNDGDHLSSSSTRDNNDDLIEDNNGGDDNLFVAPQPPPPLPRSRPRVDISFGALQPPQAPRPRPADSDQAR
jgi:hypothetical protein